MKSLLLGTIFSGVEYVLTLEFGPVPQLFYTQHVPSVTNEAYGEFPASSDTPVPCFVILRGAFDEGFKTYGPYLGSASAEFAANHLMRSHEKLQKTGLVPTWTARDDQWLIELGLPPLLADVPATETRENIKILSTKLPRLAAKKKDPWTLNLLSILRALQQATEHS